MDAVKHMKLLLEPQSVAVVGASRRTGDGSNVVENLLDYGFRGRIYPVNPHVDEILGIQAYPNITELPEVVDLAVLLTPRSTTLPVVAECVNKGIQAIIVEAGGFAELDQEGRALQEEMVRIARQGGARILGPNTFGVANAFRNFCSAFSRFDLERMPVGVVCQSGLFFAGMPRLTPGKVIDLVNTSDIDHCDALEYYEQDPEVKLILLHVEGIRNGRRFLEVASRVAANKPVIALKGGRSNIGARMAQSHSGSLSSRSGIYGAVFQRCEMIEVDCLEEMEDAALSILNLPPMAGPRLAIITFTMGGAVLLMDACQRYGLRLAELSPQTKEHIRSLFPDWAPVENPIDLGLVIAISGRSDAQERLTRLLEALLQDGNVDAIVFIALRVSPLMSQFLSGVSRLMEIYGEKPMVSWARGAASGQSLKEMGVTFPSAEGVARGLGRLWQYSASRAEDSNLARS